VSLRRRCRGSPKETSGTAIPRNAGAHRRLKSNAPTREVANVERATPKVAHSTPQPAQIIYVSVKRKPVTENSKTELAARIHDLTGDLRSTPFP
jgi:hypothetical protein